MRKRRGSLLRAASAMFLLGSLLHLSANTASAQGLREKISSLFIFGPGQDPLFLAGSGDPNNPISLQAHGFHFVPASAAENASVIGFLTDALGASVANVPIGSTSGAETFRFEAGVPVKTSTSAGPIFAERAQTLGKGRTVVGISRNSFHFTSLRGVPLNDVELIFTHENVTNQNTPGCDSIAAGDCSKMGIPNLENDIMQFRLNLDVNVSVT